MIRPLVFPPQLLHTLTASHTTMILTLSCLFPIIRLRPFTFTTSRPLQQRSLSYVFHPCIYDFISLPRASTLGEAASVSYPSFQRPSQRINYRFNQISEDQLQIIQAGQNGWEMDICFLFTSFCCIYVLVDGRLDTPLARFI